MKFARKFLFLILCLLKEHVSTFGAHSADDRDITKTLNETIAGIFQSVEPHNVSRLISTIENKDQLDKRYYVTMRNGSESVHLSFDQIQLTKVYSNTSRIRYTFQDKKIEIHSIRFTVHINGRITPSRRGSRWDFQTVMHFSDYVITAVKQSDDARKKLIDIYHKYDNLRIDFEENAETMKILRQSLCYGYSDFFSDYRSWMKVTLLNILRENLEFNTKFVASLNEIYDFMLKKPIVSKYPHFLTNESHYRYVIPTGNLGGYILKNFTIKGLSNFQSLNFVENPLTYDLLINCIRGSVSLLNEAKAGTSVSQLNFYVDSLTISVVQQTGCISVAARNYSVIHTKFLTKLSEMHSAAIIELLELSIALSVMPSMQFQRTMKPRPSSNTREIETTTKQLSTIAEKMPQNRSSPHNQNPTVLHHTTKPLDYNILFDNVDIKLITRDRSHPEQVQCEILNKMKFAQNINVLPYGKNNVSDSTGINFHANVGSVNISVIKSNLSEDDGTCRFQLHINQIVDVTASPSISTLDEIKISFQQLEIKKKIAAVLRAITKKRDHLVQIVRPVVRSSLNVCSHSVEVVNAFFVHLVDVVLKKCYLRRSTTTTNELSINTNEMMVQTENSPRNQNSMQKYATLSHSTTETLDYSILFDKVDIKLITRDQSNPEQVQCELLNKLKFAQNINVLPYGKVLDSTGINFHANVRSVNISVIKSNISKDDDCCRFQLHVNQIIDVTLSPSVSTLDSIKISLKRLEMKRKIAAVLKTITKKRDHLVQMVRPIVCSSLDVCSQSVKMVNAFFGDFVDNVLKKCSLRKKTTPN